MVATVSLDVIIQLGNGIKVGPGIIIGANGVQQHVAFIEELSITQFITEVNSGSNTLIEEGT